MLILNINTFYLFVYFVIYLLFQTLRPRSSTRLTFLDQNLTTLYFVSNQPCLSSLWGQSKNLMFMNSECQSLRLTVYTQDIFPSCLLNEILKVQSTTFVSIVPCLGQFNCQVLKSLGNEVAGDMQPWCCQRFVQLF